MSGVEVNPENIPEELKDRDQWLLWDRSNDAPRRPHWKGDFYAVSWNDPDDWHGFAEALAAVDNHDSWGLGFVVGRDNDDHAAGLYGCLDLDGCAVDGSPKEWLPDLAPFLDRGAYVEFSPSKHDPDADKHGIRIPIKGFSPPEWWTDVSVPGTDHEGVEAEGSKFQTFTGDALRGAGDEVAEHGDWVEEWLMDAYEAVTGNTAPPRRDDQQDDLTDYERAQEAHDGDSAAVGSAEDIMRALDRLDAQRVAEDTIVHTWNDGASTSDGFRAFIPTWAGGSCNGTANIVDADKWVDTGGSGRGGPAVMAAIAMDEADPENAPHRDVNGSLWWDAVEYLRADLGYDLPEPEERGAAPTPAELITRHSDQYGHPDEVPEDVLATMKQPKAADGSGATVTDTSESTPQVASALEPDSVFIQAGLDAEAGEDISDIDDREKAAAVWEIIRRNPGVHLRVRRDTGAIWAYDEGVWKPEGERHLRHAARKTLGGTNYGQSTLKELKAQARADPAVEVEADSFGLEPGELAVKNGLLDISAAADGAGDEALRSLKPSDYALTRLPIEYDPDAEYADWQAHVEEWAEHGKADALQEYVGYCLHVGELPIHRALLLVGSGANGKGTFLHVVRALLGDRENTTSIELQTLANERDALAEFYGALANIDDDLSERKLGSGLGMFKKLVGGDRVRARRLYEDGFEFDATGKHLYAANTVPQVDVADEDEAFWRRWLLVEFPNHYPPGERDPHLRDELSEPEALSGVLNWAVEGWARLMNQQRFTGEKRYAAEKRSRWQSWGDSADKFIEDYLERDEDAENVSTSQVHRRYAAWCREGNHDPVGQQTLTNRLKKESFDYGRKKVDGQSARAFGAMSFADEVPDLDETPERDDRQTTF